MRSKLLRASKLHFEAHVEKHRINVETMLENPTAIPTTVPSTATPTTSIPTFSPSVNPTAIPTEVHYADWWLTSAPQYDYSAVAISGSCTSDDDNPVLQLYATQYNGGNSSAIMTLKY